MLINRLDGAWLIGLSQQHSLAVAGRRRKFTHVRVCDRRKHGQRLLPYGDVLEARVLLRKLQPNLHRTTQTLIIVPLP